MSDEAAAQPCRTGAAPPAMSFSDQGPGPAEPDPEEPAPRGRLLQRRAQQRPAAGGRCVAVVVAARGGDRRHGG